LPAWFHVMEAAEVLRMPYPELEAHPQKAALMRRAFTYQFGKNEGERNKELNPDYHKLVAELSGEMEEARKRGTT
jgi:hypothetical protein